MPDALNMSCHETWSFYVVLINKHEIYIYFKDFTLLDNDIVIDEYAVLRSDIPWTNFNGYDVITEPITIVLKPDNEFIYENRFTGEKFGEESNDNFATQ